MSLLVVERVSKHHRHGRIDRVALSDVSLVIGPGELVAVWGLRRSGRTTLLRVAAGMERPDAGVVHFAERNLAGCRDVVLGRKIGFVQLHFSAEEGESVLDQVAGGLLAERISLATARRRALEALADAGVEECAALGPRELDCGEAVRVAISRALVRSPRLLVLDEPTCGVDVADRDPILRLLRVIASRGVAVLMSTGDGAALAGVDRVYTLDHGVLRGGVPDPEAEVIPLRRPVSVVPAESPRTG